jgi:dinuclear metal center YbgI/SA1388 family protein
MATVDHWIRILDGFFPPALAEDWDNVGLQVGDTSWPADLALVALDPTPEVVEEAVAKRCGLLVTHHPLLFRPLARVDAAEPVGATVARALEAKLAIVACHTNADVASPWGVSDALAMLLGIDIDRPLETRGDRVKLVTFVPVEATEQVLTSLTRVGAGVIGDYIECSFRVTGTGTFRPTGKAEPRVGEKGRLNEVEENRLEIVMPTELLDLAVNEMVAAHPYEEVAYDVYPVLGAAGNAGLGRVGHLADEMTAEQLAELCQDKLRSQIRLAGDPSRPVRTVAVCGGAGASLIPRAIELEVDAFVTGDVKHHQALDAVARGLSLIDAGHFGTEWPFVMRLQFELSTSGVDGEHFADALLSEISTDPFTR